ncbi:SGNH/GDSL hydrolase family protein [Kitasatospora sp. NPDC101183]|uniref:SGNH/GDSL hydrolase family protein n=1 Tax=Kitasatospora sp. NPDC101183 TaxID=3364100 RepID=UPI00380B17AA
MTFFGDGFTFGVYPGGLLGSETGLIDPVTPDDPGRINEAMRELQGDAGEFTVRAYRSYPEGAPTPADPEQYLHDGRKLDLVLQFRDRSGELGGWLDFVRDVVRAEGARIAALQICEEPNADLPVLDGSVPGVRRALVEGVVAAKETALACGFTDLAVGFNAVPTFDPADTFWPEIGELADERFHQALDHVGLDFFPDVFRPVPAEQLAGAVRWLIEEFRTGALPKAGIAPGVPIRICEHGWPTGPGRNEARQAEVVELVVRTVAGLAAELGVTGYAFFDLRDADSAGAGAFDRFGLLRDDYSRKPAFDVFRRLVGELTRTG